MGMLWIRSQPYPWVGEQGKGMERCGPKMQPKSHTHTLGIAKECEGMSPHSTKWTPILGVEVRMDFQIFREQFEGLKLIGLKSSLYH
jgi:hypothetical protein